MLTPHARMDLQTTARRKRGAQCVDSDSSDTDSSGDQQPPAVEPPRRGSWACAVCTFRHANPAPACSMCNAPNGAYVRPTRSTTDNDKQRRAPAGRPSSSNKHRTSSSRRSSDGGAVVAAGKKRRRTTQPPRHESDGGGGSRLPLHPVSRSRMAGAGTGALTLARVTPSQRRHDRASQNRTAKQHGTVR